MHLFPQADFALVCLEHIRTCIKGTLQVLRTLDAEPYALLIGISESGSGEQISFRQIVVLKPATEWKIELKNGINDAYWN